MHVPGKKKIGVASSCGKSDVVGNKMKNRRVAERIDLKTGTPCGKREEVKARLVEGARPSGKEGSFQLLKEAIGSVV